MIDIVNDILKVPIMYDYQIERRKRKRDADWDRLQMNMLIHRSKQSCNTYYIKIRSIGSKWITAVLIAVHFGTEKLIKLPLHQIYSYHNELLNNLKELKGEELKVKEIKYNHKFYYAEIDLKNEKPNLIDLHYCDICYEDHKQANENGYFNCIHKTFCNECYNQLTQKICPICRST